MADDTPRHEPVDEQAAAPVEEEPANAPTFAEYLDLQGRRSEPRDAAGGELVGAAAGGATAGRAAAADGPAWSFPESARLRSSRLPLFADSGSDSSGSAVDPGTSSRRSAQPMFGPVGVSRPGAAVALLSVLTVGVYALRWSARIDTELEEFDPQLAARSRRGSLALAVPWILGLAASLAGGAWLLVTHAGGQVPGGIHVAPGLAAGLVAGLLVVPYLVVLLPFSLVTVVMRLERLRCVEEHVGMTSDRQVRPVGLALLLVVPVAGGLLLLAAKQRRANAIWDAVSHGSGRR